MNKRGHLDDNINIEYNEESIEQKHRSKADIL